MYLKLVDSSILIYLHYMRQIYAYSIYLIIYAYLFVCLGFRGHIATVPACSIDTLTNVLPPRNAMPQTQDMTTQPVTVYRHRANLSLCYPFILMSLVRPDWEILPWLSTHTSERSTQRCCYGGSTVRTGSRTHSCFLYIYDVYIETKKNK